MSGFNANPFNSTGFNSGGFGPLPPLPPNPFPYNPGRGTYNYPQITINAPIAPPPQVLTNVPTLLVADVVGVLLFRNGLLQTAGVDYTRTGMLVTMVIPPGEGDILTASVYAKGLQLGGPNPRRYIAPWTLRLQGAFDGIATIYRIVVGATIAGVTDGVNNLFTWAVSFRRVIMYRNGLLMTTLLDYSAGSVAAVFMPGAIPQAGDILTIFGW